MTDRYDFNISFTRDHNSRVTCPICRDQFTTGYVDVHDAHNTPICNLCAWENADGLASMLSLSEAAHNHGEGGLPSAIREALKRREADPEQLRKFLADVRETIYPGGQVTPLRELMSNEIQSALSGDNVGHLQAVKRMLDECNFADPVPF